MLIRNTTKKYFLPVLFLLLLQGFGYGQQKPLVKKSYAYYYITTAGQLPKNGDDALVPIQADSSNSIEKSKPIISLSKDTSIVVFIEAITSFIQWDTAWQINNRFVITAIPVNAVPYNAGFFKGGKEIILSAAKGNYLFVLQLFKMNKTDQFSITTKPLILKGKYKGKKLQWKTVSLKEIIPLPAA